MKRVVLLWSLFSLVLGAAAHPADTEPGTSISFLENKGQVKDQLMNPRPDVLFSGTAGHAVFHLLQNGISYQFNRVDEWKEAKDKFGKSIQEPARGTTYRLDLRWKNAGAHAVSGHDALAGHSNFYCATAPMGIGFVKSYHRVIYNNLYPGIDLQYYSVNGQLKYDFIVAPGSDYRQIQLDIKGATEIHLNTDGSVLLETPLGSLTEGAPLVYQGEKQIESRWTLHGNTLAFELGKYDPKRPLLIDPLVRSWGTWYGGTGTDVANDCATDGNGNSYITGKTNTGFATVIATSGTHMSSTSSASWDGPFLVKFDPSGTRLWGTYYGAGSSENAYGCVANDQNEVYMTGMTHATNSSVIATPGSHQPALAGSSIFGDAFLAKFDNNGLRIWGTFYGGFDLDWGNTLALDATGNVYMAGIAESTNNISTPGAHQATLGSASFPFRGDGFLVKFNSSGVRQWATYYGGTQEDVIADVDINASGDIVVAGRTESYNNIASAGAHQTSFNSGTGSAPWDGFVAKFNASGVRQWGTYYGGNQPDDMTSCSIDANGNVYAAGYSSSSSNATIIATPAAFEPSLTSSTAAFLVKFNSSGVRQWGTFFAGGGTSIGMGCAVTTAGNVYFAGQTFNSSTAMSTPGAYQTVSGGSGDLFVSLFDPTGVRLESTYYGGSANESISACVTNTLNELYCAGASTLSPATAIASYNGHQPVHGGGQDGFMVKFVNCTSQPATPVNTTPNPNLLICSGKAATLTASASGTISWYASATASVAAATGSNVTLFPGAAGTYTYYLENMDCAPGPNRASVTLTVQALPSVAASTVNVCPGLPVTLTVSGASSYSWGTGATGSSITLTPTVSQSVVVTGTDAATGCENSSTGYAIVLSVPSLTLAATPPTLCAGTSASINAAGASTFTWSTGESTTQITASPTLTSVFGVTATAQNGCKSTGSVSVIVDACTGLRQMSENNEQPSVYPNPNNGEFIIESSGDGAITIFDVIGKPVIKQQLTVGNNKINLGECAKGIYFVQIVHDNRAVHVKVVKR